MFFHEIVLKEKAIKLENIYKMPKLPLLSKTHVTQ